MNFSAKKVIYPQKDSFASNTSTTYDTGYRFINMIMRHSMCHISYVVEHFSFPELKHIANLYFITKTATNFLISVSRIDLYSNIMIPSYYTISQYNMVLPSVPMVTKSNV